jgi:hypothetical protein
MDKMAKQTTLFTTLENSAADTSNLRCTAFRSSREHSDSIHGTHFEVPVTSADTVQQVMPHGDMPRPSVTSASWTTAQSAHNQGMPTSDTLDTLTRTRRPLRLPPLVREPNLLKHSVIPPCHAKGPASVFSAQTQRFSAQTMPGAVEQPVGETLSCNAATGKKLCIHSSSKFSISAPPASAALDPSQRYHSANLPTPRSHSRGRA